MPNRPLSSMKPQFLDCRDLMHNWETQRYYRTKNGNIARELYCYRCESYRIDIFDGKAFKKSASYRYANGYENKGGRIHKHDVHVEQFKRINIRQLEVEE